MQDKFILDINHPVLKNHKAYGQELLPGLAYIDIIYQLFKEKGYDYSRLELRNLSIFNPLTLGQDYDILLNIECTEMDKGKWNILIEGRVLRNGILSEEKKRYITAHIHIIDTVKFEEKLDVECLENMESKSLDLCDAYKVCREQNLIHTGFMKADGKIYQHETDVVIDITVGNEAKESAKETMFHPAILDGSGVGARTLLTKLFNDEQRLFLPLFFESFRSSELIQEKCFTRIKKSSLSIKNELVRITMEFFNEKGDKVGELSNFANKLVRQAQLINPSIKEPSENIEDEEALFDSLQGNNEAKSDIVQANNKVQGFLCKLLADKLGRSEEEIDIHSGYYEMGLDSASLLEVVEIIEEKIKEELAPTLLFEYTTISELTGYLEENYSSKFDMKNIKRNTESTISYDKKQNKVVEDIAIIGMAGYYPQAENINQFWENLKNGKDCVSEVPNSRWDWHILDGLKSPSGKCMSRWGGFMENIDCFDPKFFRISPRDAEAMDPQERLFLETCWHTIEDAGYTPNTLVEQRGSNKRNDVGVFVGVMHKDYTIVGSEAVAKGNIIPVSLSNAPIANRVSYICNFHGPSMAVDTVCSSSLTALHLALESIKSGECDVALAGGVNLSLHPNKYMTYGIMDMQSSEGYCRAFGEGGDGYVSGEGSGAVLLKPLKKAIEDNDNIYAVVKGSSINHVGTVSGITVPSPVAQGDLIETCIEKTKIDPRTISYIEAHGTGTLLGDPIEMQGLIKSFGRYTKDKQFCSIGSVKSNIGHAESAAGIIGLQKVALQLYYKTIVKSLHADMLNKYIDFDNSPFFVQQKTEKWENPRVMKNGKEISLCRRAGISSFGASGSNAHIILEEYVRGKSYEHTKRLYPHIITLSAKNEERLQEYTKELKEFLVNNKNVELQNLAYSLQVGRVDMEERVAFVVNDIEKLIYKLDKFIGGKTDIEDYWRGRVNNKGIDVFAQNISSQQLVQNYVVKGNLDKLAEIWVKGGSFDWKELYKDNKPMRISIPNYPFARESYWISVNNQNTISRVDKKSFIDVIHPLVHKNISNLCEQCYTSSFTGKEPFFEHHVIKNKKILPGVAHLEMAREAVKQGTVNMWEDNSEVVLKNIMWIRPIIATEEGVKVNIGLYPNDRGEISYKIYRDAEDTQGECVYSQGIAVCRKAENKLNINISEELKLCSSNFIDSNECYEVFRKVGFEYGKSHQGLKQLYFGSGKVVGRLSLKDYFSNKEEQFVIHPGMLDSALHASIGFMMKSDNIEPALPFALEELEIYKRCEDEMWVVIKYCQGYSEKDKIQKLDVSLCNINGDVCIGMKGFSSRVIEEEVVTKNTDTLILEPAWKEKAISNESSRDEYIEHTVIFCECEHYYKDALENNIKNINYISLWSEYKGIENRYKQYSEQIFELVKNINNSKPIGKVLVQIIVPQKGEKKVFSGILGLLKTAHIENPNIIGQLIMINPDISYKDIVQIIERNKKDVGDNHILYENGKRYVVSWNEVKNTSEEIYSPWKDKGVYLITGGAGGLGLVFADEISAKVRNAVIILTGRSSINDEKQAIIKKITKSGICAIYEQVDVTKTKDVNILIQKILHTYGTLDGIIHSAGIIRDNFISKKTKSEFADVLAPKVDGLVNIDEATKNIKLDFFMMFSSGAGVIGNVGQADYSTANAFMDAYASYRKELVNNKKRYGNTLSINWPLWRSGGMNVDKENEKMMMQSLGISPINTVTGIKLLYESYNLFKPQVMVVQGNLQAIRDKLLAKLSLGQNKAIKTSTATVTNIDKSNIINKIEVALGEAVSKILKVRLEDIDFSTELTEYGFDSITWVEFANELNDQYNLGINATIFFENSDIMSLAEYLLSEYYEVFVSKFSPVKTSSREVISNQNIVKESNKKSFRYLRNNEDISIKDSVNEKEDIAIVGMSCNFPMAKDMEQFWENLELGKDCIREIPKDRWDWKELYGDPINEPNKTNIKWGGFIEGVDEFDTYFFGISPSEAKLMDPQQRLLMTHVWKVIEDAGYSAKSLSGTNTGIFVGTANTGYSGLITKANMRIEGYSATGIVPSVGPNRMSYFLNLHGPSEPVETACSSSLIAIHRAVTAIDTGTCDMAIVGGVNTIVSPDFHISFNKAGMLSEDGRCKTFSDKANGYARGEGVGMIFLKKLSQAEKSGDHIYGIIRGSAENHGGRANSLTSPNPKAQAQLIKNLYSKSNISPNTVSYIEAHGTGTELGDPIEINGLKKAFKDLYLEGESVATEYCGLGSVKTNIGHLELAAGIAGVIKVLLQMKHKKLAKSLHCQNVNPYIDLKDSPFYIVQETKEWKQLKDKYGNNLPRRAGVSSFGFGGANAHVVLEEYVPKESDSIEFKINTDNPAVIVLSAKKKEQLIENISNLLMDIDKKNLKDSDLASIAYTLQVGREAMGERIAFIAVSMEEVKEKLNKFINQDKKIDGLFRGQVKANRETISTFTADEELMEAVYKWMERKKYPKLLEFWVKGLDIDWNKLYGNSTPKRMSLVTYSFDKKKYWIPKENNKDNEERLITNKTATLQKEATVIKKQMIQPVQVNNIITKNRVDNANTIKKPAKIMLQPLVEINDVSDLLESKSTQVSLQPVNQMELEPCIDSKEVLLSNTEDSISRELLYNELIKSLAVVLNINQNDIDEDEKFVDMGLDSITGVEWIQQISNKYGVSIKATRVYDYPSVNEFTEFLLKELSKNNISIKVEDSSYVSNDSIDIHKTDDVEVSNDESSKIDEIIEEVVNEDGKKYLSLELLQKELVQSLAVVLNMEEDDIDEDEKFIDMGLDSITGVEWIRQISNKYGVSIKATRVYDYPSIKEFSEFLEKELAKNDVNVDMSEDYILQQVQLGRLDVNKALELLGK